MQRRRPSRRLSIAAWGWIALAVWFLVFEGFGYFLEDWTLSQQWWEWMQAIPSWVAWLLFGLYVFIGIHLWWPLFGRQKGDGMDFSWNKNSKKALKTALLAALVLFLASFDTPEELLALGFPVWSAQALAVVVGAVLTSLRNYLKVAKRVNLP